MSTNTELVSKLRKETNLPLQECVSALKEAGDDYDRAKTALLEANRKVKARVADRMTSEGVVESYVHHNRKVGVIIELDCETDFVANNLDFIALAKQLAMHIASATPKFVSLEDVDKETYDKAVVELSIGLEKKPEAIRAKIIEGKISKYFSGSVLMEQSLVMDDKKTVKQLVAEASNQFGENIVVRKFEHFDIKS